MDDKRLGPYVLRHCLGEGGMGRVYLARDTQLERDVAVKVIAPEFAGARDLLARFRVEAVAQARLNHPNIVTIYAFAQEGGASVIAMEYVPGNTLKQILLERGRLGPEEALRIAAQVLDALAFAHARGILHRDIKPANIFVADDGTVKLGDFGIAKVEGVDGLTRVGTMVGTLHYSSPEQIRAKVVRPATDIYSLSVTLFEMLTGALPFGGPGRNEFDVRKGHLELTAPPPSSICPGLPSRIDALLARGLAKNPDDRYGSAQAYREAIEAVLRAPAPATLPGLSSMLAPLASLPATLRTLVRIPQVERRGLPASGLKWWMLLPLLILLILLLALMAGCAVTPATRVSRLPGPLRPSSAIGTMDRTVYMSRWPEPVVARGPQSIARRGEKDKT